MTIEFNCHACGKLLRTADDKAGHTAKCPGCGEAITVPSPAEEPPAAAEQYAAADYAAEDVDAAAKAEQGREEEFAAPPVTPQRRAKGTRTCPMCGETISRTATRCEFCGEEVGAAPARRRRAVPQGVDFGEVFSASWNIFTNEMGLAIGAFLIIMVLTFGIMMVGYLLIFLLIGAAVGAGGNPNAAAGIFFVGFGLLFVIFMLVQAFIHAGQNIFLLKLVRGENAEISDLFAGGPYYLRMLGNSIIFNLLLMVGYALCFVPGIFVILMFWPYSFVLVDENRPGLESLGRAKELTEGSWGPVFLLFLVAFLIYFGASMVCPVAPIFALPWMMIMATVVYCRLTGQRTAER